jgi:tetratricopeptide (TPR) repeat protein
MAMRFSIPSLILTMFLAAGPAGAQSVTDLDSYKDGVQAMESGNYEEAYDIFTTLLREHPANPDVNFYTGRAAFELGRYPMALFAYERILMRDPDADRVRLEMARTYLRMDQPGNAKKQFEIVLEHDPPENVRANIELYLADIEQRRKKWVFNGSIGLSWFYDDNVNYAPLDETVSTTLGDIRLQDDSRPKKDTGMAGFLALSLDRLFMNQRLAWSVGAQHYNKRHFTLEEHDLYVCEANTGIKYNTRTQALRFLIKYQDINYDQEDLLNVGKPELTWIWAPVSWFSSMTIPSYEYRDHQTDNDRDSDYYSAAQRFRFSLPGGFLAGSSLAPGIRWFQEDTEDEDLENTGLEGSLEAEIALPLDVTVYGGYTHKKTEYEGRPSSLAASDREDEQNAWHAGVRKSVTEVAALQGLALDARYSKTDNKSNFDTYTYEKETVTVTLSYGF